MLVTSSSSNRALIVWLLGTCFLLWLMIMLGGATRLTHSGLSIVEWRPVTGILPPFSYKSWMAEFAKYQDSPEYRLVNQGMALSQFKFIYLMEYTHRLLGRLIGLWFAIPLLFFWIKGWLPSLVKRRALYALGLGLAQGFMGWYMVKSGLVKDPTVSHYRLTAHLLLAVWIYGLLLWTAFGLMNQEKKDSWIAASSLDKLRTHPNDGQRTSIFGDPLPLLTCLFTLITISYGGLVAGLKAGLIYNTYPLMEGQFLPDEWSFLSPLYLNFLENPVTVQWIHRWIALITFGLVVATALKAYKASNDPEFKNAAVLLFIAAFFQVCLGVLTLLFLVPVSLGTLHQGNAIILFSLTLWVTWLLGNRPTTAQQTK